MDTTAALAWLTLLVGVPINVMAMVLLFKKWRLAPQLRVLRERFIVSVVSTVAVLFFALIFVNNDQLVPPLDVDTTKLITRSVMLGLAVIPALGWLFIYRTLGRRKGK
jgi:hypothetical protein